MDNTAHQANVKVGIFVLVALAILIVGSLWVAGSTMLAGRRVSYNVVLENSSGVGPGDRVRYAGVPVGRIDSIALRPGQPLPVVFLIAIRPDVPVMRDSEARISTTGLLGAPFLELLAGSPDGERLPPGGEIRGRSGVGLEETLSRVDEIAARAVGVMDKTGKILDQVSTDLEPIMENLERLLSESNAEDLGAILAAARRTLDDSGPRITRLIENLEAGSERLDGALEGLPDVTTRLSELLDSVHEALGPDGRRLADVLESAQGTLETAGGTLSLIGDERTELQAMMRDLRDTVANLKAFSQQVKERPFSLVRIKPEPDRRPGDGVKENAP